MNSIQQQHVLPLILPVIDFSTITTRLMESAAAVESHVQDLTHRLEDRDREIQWLKNCLQQRDDEITRTRRFNDCMYRWLLAIRGSHRKDSHRTTSWIIRNAITEVTTSTAPRSPAKYFHRVLRMAG